METKAEPGGAGRRRTTERPGAPPPRAAPEGAGLPAGAAARRLGWGAAEHWRGETGLRRGCGGRVRRFRAPDLQPGSRRCPPASLGPAPQPRAAASPPSPPGRCGQEGEEQLGADRGEGGSPGPCTLGRRGPVVGGGASCCPSGPLSSTSTQLVFAGRRGARRTVGVHVCLWIQTR